MQVDEIIRLLRPIYGNRITQLEELFLVGDEKDRREIEAHLKLVHMSLTRKYKLPLLPPPPLGLTTEKHMIAQIIYDGMMPRAWSLSREQIRRHVLVAGATGSGKTNAVFAVAKELSKRKIPWLVLDPLQSYRGLHRIARIYTVGREVASLKINLLEPPGGLSKKAWIAKIVETLAQTLDLGEGAIQVLKDALLRDNAPENAPQREPIASHGQRSKGWKETAGRALRMLTEGALSEFFQPNPSPAILLKENIILEIDSLSETEKSIFSDLLVLWIHNYRLAKERQHLDHVLVIEEAHHLLHASGRVKERPTERFLREARGVGQGIVVVDQQPSSLSPQVIAQCGTRITFQLAERDDLSAASKYSLIPSDEIFVFGKLPIGHAVVKTNSGWFEPFLVKFELQEEIGKVASDKEISSKSEAYSDYSGRSAALNSEREFLPVIPCAHTDDVATVLKSISDHPFVGVSERIRLTRWSGRKLNNAIEEASAGRLLKKITISTGSKPLTLFEPTDLGLERMKELGLPLPSGGRLGGIVHRYWINEIANGFQKLGCIVKREVVFGEKIVDLVVANGASTLLIEVETGKHSGVMP